MLFLALRRRRRAIAEVPACLVVAEVHWPGSHLEAVDGQHRLAPSGRQRPAFGRHGEGEQRAARQAQAWCPPAAQPGYLAEDLRQAEVLAAQQVALAELALLEGQQVSGSDVIDVHHVEA